MHKDARFWVGGGGEGGGGGVVEDRCLISFRVRAAGLRGVDPRGGRRLVFAFLSKVFVQKKIFLTLSLFFFAQTERSVINISRLPKQKQTIKLTTRPKKEGGKKVKYGSDLCSSVFILLCGPSRALRWRGNITSACFGCERALLPTMQSSFAPNVAA